MLVELCGMLLLEVLLFRVFIIKKPCGTLLLLLQMSTQKAQYPLIRECTKSY